MENIYIKMFIQTKTKIKNNEFEINDNKLNAIYV